MQPQEECARGIRCGGLFKLWGGLGQAVWIRVRGEVWNILRIEKADVRFCKIKVSFPGEPGWVWMEIQVKGTICTKRRRYETIWYIWVWFGAPLQNSVIFKIKRPSSMYVSIMQILPNATPSPSRSKNTHHPVFPKILDSADNDLVVGYTHTYY